MRKILCRMGLHSKFMQLDKWGWAEVCKYCDWIGWTNNGWQWTSDGWQPNERAE